MTEVMQKANSIQQYVFYTNFLESLQWLEQ